MRFAVLGPLTISGCRDITVTAAKQRTTLGVLLSHEGRAVPVPRLIDALWGADPPASAHKTLPWHVHKLRRALGDEELIRRQPNGYAIAVAADELDVTVFERHYRAGMAAVRESDWPTARDRLARGLALWRGGAYEDLGDCRLLLDEATRLSRLRRTARERHCEAELALGRHADLVTELSELVAAEPRRERPLALLMLALYRSGRRTEALKSFQDYRRKSVADTGLEPGGELRELEKRLLRDDPGLAAPVVGPPVELRRSRPKPAELPAAPAAFAGREADLAASRAALTAAPFGPAIAVVSGPGGIGKSALAAQLAHRVAREFTDGCLYVNLHGATPGMAPVPPAEVLRRFLRSLGAEAPAGAEGVEELAARFRSATDGSRLLLLLDDARDSAQVRPLLPGSASCAVIVTSRAMLTALDGARHRVLDTLPPAEAMVMLRGLIGAERAEAAEAELAEVARLCGWLPLALCIAAARLNARPGWPVSALVELLAAEGRRLDELTDAERAVRVSFLVSYRDLHGDGPGAQAARLFRLLGLLDAPDVGVATAAALAGSTEAEAAGLLDRLERARLLGRTRPGRFRTHDLIRLLARELVAEVESAADREKAIRAALHSCLATAREIVRMLSPGEVHRPGFATAALDRAATPLADRGQAQRWTVTEIELLKSLCRLGSQLESTRRAAVELAVQIAHPLRNWGRLSTCLWFARQAVEAAERTADVRLRAVSHAALGRIQRSLGHRDEAMANLRSALAGFREVGAEAEPELPSLLVVLGSAHWRAGELEQAEELVREGLARSRRQHNARYEVVALLQLGHIAVRRADFDAAVAHDTEAARLAAASADLDNQCAALTNAGTAHRLAGRPDAALAAFGRARVVAERIGDTGTLRDAEYLWGMGDVHADLDEAKRARECWRASAVIVRDLGFLTDAEFAAVAAARRPTMPAVLE